MNLSTGLALKNSPASGPPFTPATLANITHWYRTDSANVTRDGSGNVSQWSDLVGTSHLVQATGANQPKYNATDAAYNNQPTIEATAASKLLSVAVTIAVPCTVYLVGEAGTDNGVLFATGASGRPNILRVSSNVTASLAANLGSGVTFGTKRAVKAVFNGASSFVGADNWLTGGTSGTTGTPLGGIFIGAFGYASATNFTTGKLAEIIIVNGVATAADDANIAAYFTARYGVVIT